MKEKIFIFDLNNNKTFDDVEKIIQNYNFTLPSIKQLQRWGDVDYKLSDNEFKVFKAFSKHKITLYHGCKTFDINKYYKNGIMILNKKELFNLFLEYVNNINLEVLDEYKKTLKNLLTTILLIQYIVYFHLNHSKKNVQVT